MKSKLSIIPILLIAASLAFGVVANAKDPADSQSVVIHLSKYSNDLHAVNMALKIGQLMAKEGVDVTLFLDLEGVRLVDIKQPVDLKWGSGESVEGLYNRFVDAGGSVLVCPHCAKAAGVTELRKGAIIADSEMLAQQLVEADKILDY